jgi:type IV secretion system protein VirB1
MDVMALAHECAPAVHPTTMAAVISVESSHNPYAIGVVGGKLERQPENKAEAVATAKALAAAGYNFSLGIGQVNRHNLPKYDLDYARAFEPCPNIRAASLILKDCYDRAKLVEKDDQRALQAGLSCYYSGNFTTGFKEDFAGQPSYVQKVLRRAGGAPAEPRAIAVVKTASQSTQQRQKPSAYRVTLEKAEPDFSADGLNVDQSILVYR